MHLWDRCGDTLAIRIVKREAHTKDVAPHKALAGVRRKPPRVIVATSMKKECRDQIYLTAIKALCSYKRSLHYVQHAYDNCGKPGPLDSLGDGEDLSAMLANPP